MKKAKRIVYSFAFAMIIIALAFFAFQGYGYQPKQAEIVGKNTFTQSMIQADGSEVHFYASGDQYFNYLHDENGFILLRENGYLVYANNNNNGRPTPTEVKYSDRSEKIEALEKMSYSDINFSANPDLITDYPSAQSSTLYESADESRPIVNIVIYICFSGETVALNNQMIDSYMNGPQNSLTNYYQQLSYGQIMVHNINPIRNEQIYIYQDSQPRSYYQLKRGSGSRVIRERTLLNAAVTASREHFDLTGLNIDIDNDGYVDAVNFLISGSPYSEWGGMLWPHSWDLDEISSGNPATIGGLKVKKYSFNFLEQLTVGLLTHEFAHVLGVPDLYHYVDKHVAVGNWDLMHYEAASPQYMTSHLRYKYLNVLQDNQIGEVEYNGIYSLKPVTLATKNDVVAYRINTARPNEYFMVEYRNNNVTNYDSSLPGSGLIVYRIRKGITGNSAAEKNDPNNPDELYIFRPNVVLSGTEAVRSLANLNKAYLSPNNPEFSKVGYSLQQKPSSSYDPTTIYYTDGLNSGIVINALTINNGEITFEIRLSGQNNVADNYFNDKISLDNVSYVNDEHFSGIYADLNVDTNFNLTNLNNIIAVLRSEDNLETATIRLDRSKFVTSYTAGLKSFPIRFIINDKGNSNNLISVFYQNEWRSFNKPTKMDLYVVDSDNDYILLGRVGISETSATWESVEMTNIVYKTGISASLRSTIAIREDGRAYISSAEGLLNNMIIQDVISASAGVYHILYIKSDLKVVSLNNRNAGENLVGGWNNIIKVAAGEDTSYGLSLNGNVYYAGDSAGTGVSQWRNIIDIAAGNRHIVGLKNDGTVVALGSNNNGECLVGSWSDIISITAGDGFTAGLKKNGTVVIAGDVTGNDVINLSSAALWTGIKKIVAGEKHLLAINESGRVYAAGSNANGQCDVAEFYDIIDIAAGLYQTVLLREDGKLLYKGANTNSTNNINQNLKFYNYNYIDTTALVPPFAEKIMKKDTNYQLQVAALPMNATYKKVTYTSSAPSILSVTSEGYLTAKEEGIAIITATHRGSALSVTMKITVIEPIITKAMIAAGESHSVILSNDGTVTASGLNNAGQLNVNLWGNIKYVAAGGNTTAGVTPSGQVAVAGDMAGMGAENWSNIAFIATSGKTIIGVNTNGNTIAIGDDSYQQVSAINGRSDIIQVGASTTHSVLLTSSGTVIAEGNNFRGQLNTSNWRNIIKISAGEGYTLGLREDGTIFYAGQNNYVSDMSQLSDWIDIVNISAGSNHIAGVDCNGKVFAIGNNSFGQLNTEALDNIGIIAVGGEHTIGIGFDGSISGVGRNNDSRLVLPAVNPLPFIELQSATFASATFGIRVLQTKRIKLSIAPYNATDRNNDNISYASNNNTVASVDSNGYITGIATGEAIITATITKADNNTITTTATVYIYDRVEGITWVQDQYPSKTVYSYQERLDLLGGQIRVDLANGKNFVTSISRDMVVGFDTATNQLGERNVLIKVDGSTLSVDYKITVINTIKSATISNSTNLKNVYDYGDTIDLNGGWIQATLANGNLLEPQTMISLLNSGDSDGTRALEVIANTNVISSTIVTLKYTDLIARQHGINNVLYLSYEIAVFDKVMSLSAQMNKTSFKYGEEIFGNGNLIVNMKSGNNIIEEIKQKDYIEEGVDSVVTISNYDKYMFGVQGVKLNYYNPDFDISETYFPIINITVEDTIIDVTITSMTLNDAAVYEKNKHIDQSISARVSFAGGAAINVGYDGELQMFENMQLSFTNNSNAEEGYENYTMAVLVKSSAGGGSSFVSRATKNVKVLGLSDIVSISFMGGSEFPYGSQTNLKLKIITSENAEGYDIDIDDFRLGVDNTILTTQTITFSMMGKTASKNILFKDYVVGIYTPYLNVTALIGEPLQVQVYGIMASGAQQSITNWIAVNYNNNQQGLQQVTLSHMDSFYYTITVNVINAIDNIVVVSSPKTNYTVHEEIDLSAFSVRISFLQGTPEVVFFSEEDFTATGFDKNIIGLQVVIITYSLTGHSWEYIFEVRNKIKMIQVDYSKSKLLYTVNEDLNVTITCIYENGDRESITEGFTSNFDKSQVGKEQVVNINYWGLFSTALIVEIIDAPREISIKAPAKKYYEYGEPLNLDGGMITIITQTGKRRSESLNAYRNYLSTFNPTPTTKGGQMITLSIPLYDVSASFIVYVKDKSSSNMLVSKEAVSGIRIDRTNTRVVLDDSASLAEFSNMVDSYAQLHYKTNSGYIDIVSNQQVLISSNMKIEIRNTEGSLIETYSVFIKGDATGDGKFDASDLPLLSQALLLGLENTAIYADYTGDKMYTLTDYVKWVEKAESLSAEGGN